MTPPNSLFGTIVPAESGTNTSAPLSPTIDGLPIGGLPPSAKKPPKTRPMAEPFEPPTAKPNTEPIIEPFEPPPPATYFALQVQYLFFL